MIKAAILGGHTDEGGELIRILAMHPDVEIVAAQAAGHEGRPITSRHHGLIGETDLTFTSTIDYQKCDVLFVCGNSIDASGFNHLRMVRPDLKIICFHPVEGVDMTASGTVYGLPEIYRKLLVRGSTAAFLPSPFASMALVALYPLALHLLLRGDISISLSAPEAILEEYSIEKARQEIEYHLREAQRSFEGNVEIKAAKSKSRRSAIMEIEMECALDYAALLDLYEIYSDHNFAFAVTQKTGVSEVAGTNKCIVTPGMPSSGRVTLSVAADCRLRGAAGEAVHVMNLMFGLHERTGLALKAIDYQPVDATPDNDIPFYG